MDQLSGRIGMKSSAGKEASCLTEEFFLRRALYGQQDRERRAALELLPARFVGARESILTARYPLDHQRTRSGLSWGLRLADAHDKSRRRVLK